MTGVVVYCAGFGLGLGISVVAYLRLLRGLREDHAELWEAMGRPVIWSGSPTRSARLQAFIYGHEPASERVHRVRRFLRWFTPAYVLFALVGIPIVAASLMP